MKSKAGKKGKKGKEMMDESTSKIIRLYRRKCESYEVALPNKFFREKVDEVIENNEDLKQVNFLSFIVCLPISCTCGMKLGLQASKQYLRHSLI